MEATIYSFPLSKLIFQLSQKYSFGVPRGTKKGLLKKLLIEFWFVWHSVWRHFLSTMDTVLSILNFDPRGPQSQQKIKKDLIIYICKYVCKYVCMYVYICTCMHLCVPMNLGFQTTGTTDKQKKQNNAYPILNYH